LLDLGGPAMVTLREVGRRAGVSHNAPYKHFASKELLLAAIASRELSRHSKAMKALPDGKVSGGAIRGMLHGYIRWAHLYPQRFKLTFGPPIGASDELGQAAGEARALLVDMVRAAQRARQLPPGHPERLASLLQALAHGAADLSLSGHLSKQGKGQASPQDLVDDLLTVLRARAKAG